MTIDRARRRLEEAALTLGDLLAENPNASSHHQAQELEIAALDYARQVRGGKRWRR